MEEKRNGTAEAAGRRERWWRTAADLVAFMVLFGVLMVLVGMPVIALGFGNEMREIVPGSVPVPLMMAQELLMLVCTLLAVWILLRFGMPFTGLGLSLKGWGKDWIAGTLFAIVLYLFGFGLSLLLGVVEVTDVAFDASSLLMSLLLFLLVSAAEETMMRGFVLGRLLDGGVNRFVALFISSTSFSLMHLFNPNFEFLPFLNILLAGVLLGASYIYTRNLCFPVALHWFWNWLQGPVLGYEVSGNRFGDTLLTLRLSDAHLMNGGSFGFEGSLLCTFLLIIGSGLIIGHYERKIRRFP